MDRRPEYCCCCVCIPSATVGILENLGAFNGILKPGCTCLPRGEVRALVPLSIQTVTARVETKTRDNAVIRLQLQILYKVIEGMEAEAYYRFTDPADQITSYTASIVRGEVPKYTLDEVFQMSQHITQTVKVELSALLREYGFEVESTLLTQIEPSVDVRKAISQTMVNYYARIAAEHEAEIKKMIAVKDAEADYEEKRLSGVGFAAERQAIMHGLQSSIEDFICAVPNMTTHDVLILLLLNQYFDGMKASISPHSSSLLLLPAGMARSPGVLMGSAVASRSQHLPVVDEQITAVDEPISMDTLAISPTRIRRRDVGTLRRILRENPTMNPVDAVNAFIAGQTME